jgi:hypothetical protein
MTFLFESARNNNPLKEKQLTVTGQPEPLDFTAKSLAKGQSRQGNRGSTGTETGRQVTYGLL